MDHFLCAIIAAKYAFLNKTVYILGPGDHDEQIMFNSNFAYSCLPFTHLHIHQPVVATLRILTEIG